MNGISPVDPQSQALVVPHTLEAGKLSLGLSECHTTNEQELNEHDSSSSRALANNALAFSTNIDNNSYDAFDFSHSSTSFDAFDFSSPTFRNARDSQTTDPNLWNSPVRPFPYS